MKSLRVLEQPLASMAGIAWFSWNLRIDWNDEQNRIKGISILADSQYRGWFSK